jgi:hypothetical protein
MSGPGRNAPCPCGSGLKYKKCCLPKDEAARAAPAPNARTINHRGKALTVSGSPSEETLDLAADYFERKDAGDGYGAQIARFSQPLIDAAGNNPTAIQNAMTLGAIFWNVAIAGEDGAASLADVMERMTLDEEGAAEIRALAARMVDRHVAMFPELHAERGARRAATAG